MRVTTQRLTGLLQRGTLAVLLFAGLAWAGAAGALWIGQEHLLFKPEPLPPDARLSDAPDVSERFVDVPGARLSVLELRLPDPKGVVFFLHGNAGNLERWFVNTERYTYWRQAVKDIFDENQLERFMRSMLVHFRQVEIYFATQQYGGRFISSASRRQRRRRGHRGAERCRPGARQALLTDRSI